MWKNILKAEDMGEWDFSEPEPKRNIEFDRTVKPVTLEETKDYLASINEKSRDGPATISALKLMIRRWDAKDNTFDPALGASEIIRLHKKQNE